MFIKKVTRPPLNFFLIFFNFFLGVGPGSPKVDMEIQKRDIM